MGRIFGVAATAAVLIVLVVLYAVDFLTAAPPAVGAVKTPSGATLTLQTVPSFGHGGTPDWVSYLVRDSSGHWVHSTVYKLPAHTQVKVTIYQYDSATGLRNPFFAQVRGTQNGVATLNGKPFRVVNADDTSHTFTVPDLGLSVPLSGTSANAKNPCSVAPCSTSFDHTTITFSFMTPGPGKYRFQCFVPCGASFIYGFGGPMQTIGYMSGWLEVA